MRNWTIRMFGAVGTVALLTAFGACSSEDDSKSATTRAEETTTTAEPEPTPAADQTPPSYTNGIAVDGSRLWIADLQGSQILVVDAATGAILERFGANEGVTGGPDDLVLVDDDTAYYTAFLGGQVGRLRAGRGEVLATVGPGANPIALAPSGDVLYVGRAQLGTGLFRVEPESGAVVTVLADDGGLNAFAFGPDDALYAPRPDGAVVRVDVETGAVREVATGFGLPVSVRYDAANERLLVLSTLPPSLDAVDLDTGARTPVAKPATMVVDNFAIADDGTVYVTAFNEPVVSVIAPDGSVTTIEVGTR